MSPVGEVVDQELRGLRRDPAGQRVAGAPRPVRVGPQQQRVVVEHLLEVRHHPVGVDAVAREPAGQLVVDPAARHRRARALHRGQRRRRAGALVGAQQRLQQSRRRELRRAAEAAALGVLVAQDHRRGVIAQRSGRSPGPPPGRPEAIRRSSAGDLVAGLLDLVALGAPGVGDGGQQLQELRLGVVGAAEERAAVGGEEAGHRPAALAGHARRWRSCTPRRGRGAPRGRP